MKEVQLKSNPFTPKFEELPETLPIFPLPGAVVLPRAQLPLNIFEPRYLNMTFDALGGHRMIGMIQPQTSQARDREGAIHKTGCAGRITAFKETDDGRLLIILTGVCRYDVAREVSVTRGYRRIQADWGRFARDLSADAAAPEVAAKEVIRAVKPYLEAKKLEVDWDSLVRMEGEILVNYLTMHMPFGLEEKQALVEAVTPSERAKILATLCAMSLSSQDSEDTTRH
jgi:Lon protease-like protein